MRRVELPIVGDVFPGSVVGIDGVDCEVWKVNRHAKGMTLYLEEPIFKWPIPTRTVTPSQDTVARLAETMREGRYTSATEIEEVTGCDYCNGSREGQRWDSDLKQMVTVPNGCRHCCGEEDA